MEATNFDVGDELLKLDAEHKKGSDILSSLERWDYIQSLDIKIEWIVDRLIPKESITLVFGKGGIGKTWLSMDIARCIGEGIPYLGLTTIKTPVIFVDFENPLAVLNTRTQKLGDSQNVYFWRANNERLKPSKLDSADWEIYKSLPKGAVLIFDTLRASHRQDENKSDGMALIMERMKELRDMGFTIILLHHTAKNSDRIAKGSTAIVDLADHIIGLTMVKKNRGEDVVIEDEDSEDDKDMVYRFGVREKTRFDPYHIYLTLNPDRGFELAPDPQEDTLKDMHRILAEHDMMTKTVFAETCNKKLGIAVNRVRKMIDMGHGRYWDIEKRKDQKNAQVVIPKSQFYSFTDIYSAVKLKNCPETTVKQDNEKTFKTPVNIEFDSFTTPLCKTEKQEENSLNIMEGVI